MTPGRIVEFAEELARISASGGGIAALAAALAAATDAAVLVEDDAWRHIARAGRAAAPPTARGLFEAGDPGDQLPRAHTNGKMACSAPILVAGNRAAWLSLFTEVRDAAIFARLGAAAMAVELARGLRPTGHPLPFFERLLQGAYLDAAQARSDAGAQGVELASHYVIVALEILQPTAESNAPADSAALRDLALAAFRSVNAAAAVLDRGARLIAFIPAEREIDCDNAQTAATLLPKTAAKRKTGVRFCGGVATAKNALDVPRAAQSAQTALTISRRIYGDERVVAYDDLGVYPLLCDGAGVEALRALSRGVLAPLRRYDEKHQTELERTLMRYFECGQNVKTAAAELHVHRHTVFYRLRQITEITGRSLESAHDQLTLRLAIAIDALHTD